jgi:hypothetical protein
MPILRRRQIAIGFAALLGCAVAIALYLHWFGRTDWLVGHQRPDLQRHGRLLGGVGTVLYAVSFVGKSRQSDARIEFSHKPTCWSLRPGGFRPTFMINR